MVQRLSETVIGRSPSGKVSSRTGIVGDTRAEVGGDDREDGRAADAQRDRFGRLGDRQVSWLRRGHEGGRVGVVRRVGVDGKAPARSELAVLTNVPGFGAGRTVRLSVAWSIVGSGSSGTGSRSPTDHTPVPASYEPSGRIG